ncbi:hypothetical protein SARC_07693 [Sphaeroforma arctica JP610]|uniref:Arrestin C-terminal-like domain-containing protein n=1 Tax=Sphaeroforma arctica JP610 TaxID=667725 RepID=A0A0L0FVG4_9EUKA|nr:hypothetical protein SARC_07693 [Sphaeroforma arctica JP610]KNC79933.1 hypothetical protein SARC_07693 [Sphaeroforma arctica JP610]|eukprot:XP_014153835.1 hypothetical protein SARC_07693 [Sphaeroforma arctica JP610]
MATVAPQVKVSISFVRDDECVLTSPIYYDNDSVDGSFHIGLEKACVDSQQEVSVSLVCRVADETITLGEELYSTRQVLHTGGALDARTHSFPFSFHIPMNKLPPSLVFENQACIQWAVVGHYYQSATGEVIASLREIQKQTLYLSSPELRPISHVKKRLFRMGTMSVKAELDKAVYHTKEDIKVTIQIESDVPSRVKGIELCARQNKVLRADGRLHFVNNKKPLSVQLDAARTKLGSSESGNMKANETVPKTWERTLILKPRMDSPPKSARTRKNLVVKSESTAGLCPTTMYFFSEAGTQLLTVQITYQVEVKIRLSGISKNVTVLLPFIISDSVSLNLALPKSLPRAIRHLVKLDDRATTESLLCVYHLKPPQNKPPHYARLNEDSIGSEGSYSSYSETDMARSDMRKGSSPSMLEESQSESRTTSTFAPSPNSPAPSYSIVNNQSDEVS